MKKSYSFMTTLLVSLAVAFSACEKEPTYMIKISATEGGTIEGRNGEYKEHEWVEFRAIPEEGYFFAQWSDGKNDNPRSFFMNKDITIIAQFEKITTIDLGLTSGNLWTTCNLGAAHPWDRGHYYAWGETETKNGWAKYSNWNTYKYGTSKEELTKYCNDAYYGLNGFTDNFTVLEPADDAATVVYGSDYYTPTSTDWVELSSQCYWVWTDNFDGNNVSGYIVYKAKSDNDKGHIVNIVSDLDEKRYAKLSYSLSEPHIFLPVAGECGGYKVGETGSYWSSTLTEDTPYEAYCCFFYDGNLFPTFTNSRDEGHSIRAIRRR